MGHRVTAINDPGSDLHLMRASYHLQIGAPKIREGSTFDGVGSVNVKTLGRITAEIEIDTLEFEFDIDIVLDVYITNDLLIGGELSDYAEVQLKHRQATLLPIAPTEAKRIQTEDPGWNHILNINVRSCP